jgi:aspartate 1-decarboxylase
MLRTMLKSKIHRATVTHADLHYVGSLSVDRDLMRLADLAPAEQVCVVNVNNGARYETYVIPAAEGSGVIGVNGASARLAHPGDLLIILSYAQVDNDVLDTYQPRIVHVDAANRPLAISADPAGAVDGMAQPLTPAPNTH